LSAPSLIRQLWAALPHALIHAAGGMVIAALLGWLETVIRNRIAVNEFNGLAWVIAVYFTGPIACALAAPLHVVCHARVATAPMRHLYSVTLSTVSYAVAWMALHLLASGSRP
jgi:hypothetical protein